MRKSIISIVILLMLLPIAHADFISNFYTTIAYNMLASNSNQFYTATLQQDVSTEIQIRSTTELSTTALPILISPINLSTYEYIPIANNSYLYYDCLGTERNISLSSLGVGSQNMFNLVLFLYPGPYLQTTTSTMESDRILYSTQCKFKIYNQDAALTIGIKPEYKNSLDSLFTVPDQATNSLISRIKTTLFSMFDVIKMILIVAAFILLLFILIAPLKTVLYFISQLRVRRNK